MSAMTEVGRRYARALFESLSGAQERQASLEELRQLQQSLRADSALMDFFCSKSQDVASKLKVLEKLGGKLQPQTLQVLNIFSEKNRWEHFESFLSAFEEIIDSSFGVIRGSVRSAAPLTPEQRKKVEETVQGRLGKKVILSFYEDRTLLGGMIAQVGGWTFDDSISNHLSKLNEHMKRRSQESWKQ